MADSIFRKESLKKVSSPEELNDYIKVANPGIWIVIAAAVVLIIAVAVWGVCGSLQTTVNAKGVAQDGKITCYLPEASSIEKGQEVSVSGCSAKVKSVSQKPVSYDEAAARCNDEYTVYLLGLADWNYVVEIQAADCTENGVVSVSIVTGSVSPISFIWD